MWFFSLQNSCILVIFCLQILVPFSPTGCEKGVVGFAKCAWVPFQLRLCCWYAISTSYHLWWKRWVDCTPRPYFHLSWRLRIRSLPDGDKPLCGICDARRCVQLLWVDCMGTFRRWHFNKYSSDEQVVSCVCVTLFILINFCSILSRNSLSFLFSFLKLERFYWFIVLLSLLFFVWRIFISFQIFSFTDCFSVFETCYFYLIRWLHIIFMLLKQPW